MCVYLPKPEIKVRFPTLQAVSLPSEPHGQPKIVECVAYPFSGDLPNPGIELGSPALQEDSLPAELLLQKPSTTLGELESSG